MFILVAIAAALASPAPCRITVHPAAVSHAISDLTMGCHSDPGYAHQSRGLSAEMLVGNAFELVPDAPLVPPPKAGYRCAWDGVFHTFNTHGGGAGDVEIETSGRTDAEKDADCCARCDCEPLCEFWQRDDGSNSCSLRRSFAGFDNSSGKSTVRGNFKNASKGSCEVADALLLSNSGWLSRGKMGHATLDSSSSPVPQGLWAPPSRSLLLASAGDGAVNRGFGGEGLFLQPGKEYDGYLVLKSSAPTTVTVSLRPFGGGAALATANVKFAGGNWSAAKFTLMPSAGTSCVGVSAAEARAASISCPVNNTYVSMDGGWGRNSAAPGGMSDLTAHVCVQCGGEFTLAKLSGGAEVRVGFASLTPGAWGRYKGSTARKDSVEALQKMGVKMMRSGGSVACDPTMAWTSWRGPMWQRPSASTQGNWVHSLVSGWGLFEVIDMASAAGITPIITLFGGMSGEDGHAAKRCQEMENGTKDRYGDKACDLKSAAYGDLLEYCHGDDGTEFGKLRHDDGHPDIFNVSIFELGNEQYNANFADQVAAMESRAKKIGLAPKTLRYLWPQGPGDSPGRPSFAPSAADAKAINALGLGSRIMSDIHGPAIGGVAKAEQVFSTAATKHWGAMNLETNCGDHTMHRALTEARDLNLFHRYPNPKLQGRAGSFCMERSGYNEGFANDQGLAFFLPNMTFLQPPGFVHAMISETWQPNAVNFTLSAGCAALNVSAGDVSASASADGKQATLRVVNENAAALQVAASLGGGADSSAQASVLEGSACAKDPTFPYVSEHKRCSNTPGEPTLFSPSTWAESGSGTGTTVPGYSFAVFKLKSDDAESANTATLTIGAASHRTRRMDMGCHSDSGYSHQPMGLHAQRLFGESFEQPPVPQGRDAQLFNGNGWRNASTGTGIAVLDRTPSAAFHGTSSLRMSVSGGGNHGGQPMGRAAVVNRGLGMEGLHFEKAKVYEGYLFVKSPAEGSISVAIESWGSDGSTAVLAKQTLSCGGSLDWVQLNFSLTPSAACECEGITPGGAEAKKANVTCVINGTYSGQMPAPLSDSAAHVCVRCAGQLVIEKTTVGEVHVDFVYLSPGSWGRYKGLPVLKRGVDWLQKMGTSLFRMGGSFSGSSFYHWKKWRGKPWTRPSAAAEWGHDFLAGWGPFEMVDMTNAMDIPGVITTYSVGSDVSPQDFGDLVEYSFGDASTEWGAVRIKNDSHPAVYNWSYIELGNEQYNPSFVDQVKAMEARANQPGVKGNLPAKLNYLFPSAWNAVPQGTNSTQAASAAALGLGDRLMCDLHCTWWLTNRPTFGALNMSLISDVNGGVVRFAGGPNVQCAGKPQGPSCAVATSPTTQGWGAMNLETNCGDHTFRRALEEAFDLNTWANEGNSLLKGRGASFCMERSGFQEGGLNDQGLIFFLPNMTWGQPPLYVHQMIHEHWQPRAHTVNLEMAGVASAKTSKGIASAQSSDDGKSVVVRFVNVADAPLTLSLNTGGALDLSRKAATMCVLSADIAAVNTPSQPENVVPKQVAVADPTKVLVPPHSFVLLVFAEKL